MERIRFFSALTGVTFGVAVALQSGEVKAQQRSDPFLFQPGSTIILCVNVDEDYSFIGETGVTVLAIVAYNPETRRIVPMAIGAVNPDTRIEGSVSLPNFQRAEEVVGSALINDPQQVSFRQGRVVGDFTGLLGPRQAIELCLVRQRSSVNA